MTAYGRMPYPNHRAEPFEDGYVYRSNSSNWCVSLSPALSAPSIRVSRHLMGRKDFKGSYVWGKSGIQNDVHYVIAHQWPPRRCTLREALREALEMMKVLDAARRLGHGQDNG